MTRFFLTPATAAARALAIAGALLFAAAPAKAEALPRADCPLSLTVATHPLMVEEEFDRSFSQMDAISDSDSDSAPLGGAQGSVGNTRVAIAADNKMSWDGGCGTLNITVGYTHAKVYVARELERNACAREHVLAHERHHVALYRRALLTLAERTHAKLAPLVARISPTAITPEDVDMLLEVAMEEAATVMPEHAAFDSDEEYARNLSACDGAISRLFRRALRPRGA
jgi:hypothetical protein